MSLPMSINPFPLSHSHKVSVLSASKPLRPRWPRMGSTTSTPIATAHRNGKKEKIVVVMGATGTGKSKLSIDLATRFGGEIINSDKMQVYKGLDITTNKIPPNERRGVPHYLLGEVDPEDGELTPEEFRQLGESIISDITSRKKLPLIVGGSNSLVHALVVEKFDPESNVFDGSGLVSSELRYNCCFLWVDVSFLVLSEYLSKRVDDMLDMGMFEELAEFYDPAESENTSPRTGLGKAIGVPEFERYFKRFPSPAADPVRKSAYEEAVREIKDNTCQLAKQQIGKIIKLRGAGWDLRKMDATEALIAVMTSAEGRSEIWEKQVLEPSVKIVKAFLEE
ncbi:adenylate isopentenyltransferase-like [Corylus avellana]|uniref:adenylate isopentenyltransferase-like n=1 Tax=Corylus avellana TaxID=13451 RepID=UPI001E2034B7|nr:adenylate isopentenyltransferase-like [Corylus avellana]